MESGRVTPAHPELASDFLGCVTAEHRADL